MAELKILVCGDVGGNFKQLFSKIDVIHHKRGPFEYLLCVGSFFGSNNDEWPDVLSGKIKVPLLTYILGPNTEDHVKFYPSESGELAPNLIYLGKQGTLTGSSGLRIAYLSGIQESKTMPNASFTSKDITKLIASASSDPVDILLTSPWPKGVTKYAKFPDQSHVLNLTDSNSTFVAYVAKILKPRYHFAGCNGIFYERIPYRNHQILNESPVPPTRFIGLAPVKNEGNSKWIYAFNIAPIHTLNVKDLINAPGTVTECPFRVEESQDKVLDNSLKEHQYFYDMCSSSEAVKPVRKHKGQKRPLSPDLDDESRHSPEPIPQDKCWFCLTNPKLEKHLIISIGEHSYVAMAKGGLVDDHLLIIPMEHVKSSTLLSDKTEKEMDAYRTALVKYFHDNGKDTVFFERHFSTSHVQINVVPIPKNPSNRVNLKTVILEEAEVDKLKFSELSRLAVLKQIMPNGLYMFFDAVIDKRSELRLLHIVEKRVPINFGRMVLANRKILDVPDRIDWINCKLEKHQEMKIASKIKESFKPYDISSS